MDQKQCARAAWSEGAYALLPVLLAAVRCELSAVLLCSLRGLSPACRTGACSSCSACGWFHVAALSA